MPQAGLLDLVAHGIQDIYLIGNPQITFFKTVYKRHTNFSMEYITENFKWQNLFRKRKSELKLAFLLFKILFYSHSLRFSLELLLF